MIERIEGAPNGVLAFKAVGEVHSDDYEQVLDPAVQAVIDAGDKVRLVYVLGDELEGISSGAAWEDTKLGMGHLTSWERMAVVTDRDWIEHTVKLFGWMVPGKVKVFSTEELPDAMAWAAAA